MMSLKLQTMIFYFLFFSSTFVYTESSTWDNLTVTIAVVEYQPFLLGTVGQRVQQNLIACGEIAQAIRNETVIDMIIFPEASLQNNINSSVEVVINTTLKLNESMGDPISFFSLQAWAYQTYIVINLVEKSKCEGSDQSKNCKDYGFHYYNTDVVFDRNGTVINKYRKYNLFGEKPLEKPAKPEQVVVKTDFGVNLGIFTCFDILFKSPAQDLLSQSIDGVIFPSLWFSELPFLTALQTQQMWSQEHGITLIAAGTNNPLGGSGGSGVYGGSKGALLGGIIAEGGSQPFIYKSVNGEIPPQESPDVHVLAKSMDTFYLMTDISIGDYKNLILNAADAGTEAQLYYQNGTENKIYCDFSIRISKTEPKLNMNFYTYHLVAYSGVRSFSGLYNGGTEVCAIIACLNSSLTSCGQRFPKYEEVDWPVTFEEITIKANFEKSENKTQFPNSLLSSIRPIDAAKTTWASEDVEESGESLVQRTFSITEKQDRLLTFAIYGRNFAQDFAPPDDSDEDDDNHEDGKGAENRIRGVDCWLLLFFVVFLPKCLLK